MIKETAISASRAFTLLAFFMCWIVICPVTRGGLILNVSDNGSGGVALQVIASGTVQDSGILIGYGTAGDTFLNDGVDVDFDDDGNTFTVAGSIGTTFSSDDRGDESIGINSGVQFQIFSPFMNIGDSLTALSGDYDLEDMDFSRFIAGSYSLIKATGTSNFADVGTVTLNVAAASVPEPSTFALLGLGVLILGRRSCQRRKTA